MKQLLEQQGYQLNAHKVWQRPEFSGIAYSDGDEIENRIWDAIKSTTDRRVLSPDLKRHCTDWASLYHLTGMRANLMRPLSHLFKGDILEIGAGCGAITRYLGECTAGTTSQVLALEGSPRRAAIARARTQGFDHITVVTEQFDTFAPARQFDVVTLIGVLEYANLFTGGPTAALSMLARARELVKPGGHLVIAIENQFGLKYFAGAPEDHLGIPMFGIESRYGAKQAKTFGKKALQTLLRQAGFSHDEFLAPFPDYKLPVSVISQTGMQTEGFDAAALAWQSARKDPQLPATLHFSPELAWPDLFANGLGMELSNSFLIVAGDKAGSISADTLAWHYSSERRPEFCKETRFKLSGDLSIQVEYRPLAGNGAAVSPVPSTLQYEPGTQSRYLSGHCLSWSFIKTLSQDGWTKDQLSELMTRYRSVLKKEALASGKAIEDWNSDTQLPGHLFDAVPHNVMQTSDGSYALIDTEWSLTAGVSLGHLLFRAMLLTLSSMSRMGLPADPLIHTRKDFVTLALACGGLTVTDEQIQTWMQVEADLQSAVTAYPPERFLDWSPQQPLPTLALSQKSFDNLERVSQCHRDLAQHHERLLIDALERKQAIEHSTSWRFMAPVRALLSALRGR